jgi:hypothetical protein
MENSHTQQSFIQLQWLGMVDDTHFMAHNQLGSLEI